MDTEISVVIPTYNRAHLLERTVPSYIQPGVGEVILVDDASTDYTSEIVGKLQERYPLIRYIRLPQNQRQMYAKNRGIDAARYPLIYFGDDDSFIIPGSIQRLVDVIKTQYADIAGAKALYMNSLDDLTNIEQFIRNYDHKANDTQEIADLVNLQFNFTLSTEFPVEVPVTPACFLIKKEWAQKVLFDENYKINAYREETDFLVRAYLNEAKIFYEPKAIQINLPRTLATGGAHAKGKLIWYLACIYNNWYFLKKNYFALSQKCALPHNVYAMQWMFMMRGLRKIISKFFP
ncbi:glycosyltransferase family 2 protein [Acetonema longum]|uniref:Putative glycosyltransferase n=1 Tax=Acetonema longum DSM 6540 TaxID=1009370 RepID=F7NNR6_9FIRM|nr:glycosyltransferase family 2 protein [Acetonema longum]EGO62250.1 putative glycosyltransferase [Acetonema longum DSM 6540]